MSKRAAENLPIPADDCRPSDGGKRSQAAGVAALAVAVGKTVKDAAAEAGIGVRTLYSWLKKPAFRRRVSAIREQMVGAAVGRVSRDMASAADVLGKLLKSRSEDTRFKAAAKLIELGVKLRDHDDLAGRLAEVERELAGRRAGP